MKQVVTDIPSALENYLLIAEGIAKTFGSYCEVVVHDLRNVSSSIVAIYNGHVTGREVGSPVTDLGLTFLRKRKNENLLLNYPNNGIKGKKIKSTSVMIREEGVVIGCLCINIDITLLSMAGAIINDLMHVEEKNEEESFPINVSDLENQIIEKATRQIGKPISLMDKNERMEFIHMLDEMGLFLIKGTIQNIAKLLDVSKFTIYNYLEKKP